MGGPAGPRQTAVLDAVTPKVLRAVEGFVCFSEDLTCRSDVTHSSTAKPAHSCRP